MQPSPLSSCYSPEGLKTFLNIVFSNEKCDSYVFVLDTTCYCNGLCSSRQEAVLYFEMVLLLRLVICTKRLQCMQIHSSLSEGRKEKRKRWRCSVLNIWFGANGWQAVRKWTELIKLTQMLPWYTQCTWNICKFQLHVWRISTGVTNNASLWICGLWTVNT
jgi:hypothetical protein